MQIQKKKKRKGSRDVPSPERAAELNSRQERTLAYLDPRSGILTKFLGFGQDPRSPSGHWGPKMQKEDDGPWNSYKVSKKGK